MKLSEIPKQKGRSFLDALFYSDSVSAIGFRADGESFRAVAVNWEEDEASELDERVSEMITKSLQNDENLDEISAYCKLFPETVQFNPEWQVD